jgi:hypothetical protein
LRRKIGRLETFCMSTAKKTGFGGLRNIAKMVSKKSSKRTRAKKGACAIKDVNCFGQG